MHEIDKCKRACGVAVFACRSRCFVQHADSHGVKPAFAFGRDWHRFKHLFKGCKSATERLFSLALNSSLLAGFGLSYTNFSYSSLSIDGRTVSFTLTNTGKRAVNAYCSLVNLPCAQSCNGWDMIDCGAPKLDTCSNLAPHASTVPTC